MKVSKQAAGDSPKIILINRSNSPHLGDFSSNTNKLETNVGAGFNGQPLMVSKLRRRGVGVVDTGLGDGLGNFCQSTNIRHEIHHRCSIFLPLTYVTGSENP